MCCEKTCRCLCPHPALLGSAVRAKRGALALGEQRQALVDVSMSVDDGRETHRFYRNDSLVKLGMAPKHVV